MIIGWSTWKYLMANLIVLLHIFVLIGHATWSNCNSYGTYWHNKVYVPSMLLPSISFVWNFTLLKFYHFSIGNFAQLELTDFYTFIRKKKEKEKKKSKLTSVLLGCLVLVLPYLKFAQLVDWNTSC
jgi:hypothetical protein